MSRFGANFLRELPRRCKVEGQDPPDVQFNPSGYLFLASESGAQQLLANRDVQMLVFLISLLLQINKFNILGSVE